MSDIPFGRAVELVTERSPQHGDFRIGLEAITKETGRLNFDLNVEYDGDGIAFQPGDVLFGKLRPNLAKAWLADRQGEAVGDFHVYRPREAMTTSRYLAYLVLSDPFLGPVIASVSGAKMPRADWSEVRNVKVWLPSAQEQEAIADYLDRETAQIDAFIAKNEELIALLEERRDSIWNELYDVALEHSEPILLRRLVASIVDGPFGSSLTSAHYSASGTRVIRLGNIGINEFKDMDKAFIPDDYASSLSAHAASPGDVIVAGLGDDRMPLGRACVLPEIGPAIVKADCYRVRPSSAISSEFLAWSMSSPKVRGQFTLLARGTTRQRLNTSVVLDVRIPAPGSDVESRILAESSMVFHRIETSISAAESAIELARERRAALISAAVTGKIDVSKEAVSV
ncbi:hypothetical protein [Gulosibacter sediminis]|uniref:hypothetical protein n=1 Tax=Gulosibacter sediminis TaxID=1729695 RepID=UPI0024AD25B9|nr:hypothetical protein [Gulosibacter sediminis]